MRDIAESAHELLRLLDSAVKKELDGKTAISFSGGLDSTIIASIALRHTEVTGYTVGIPGSYDLDNAERTAREIGLELKRVELSREAVLGLAPKVKEITGLGDRMNIGIGIPLYASCMAAAGDGFSSILCGQGADELFAGYARYTAMEETELTAALERDFLALGTGGLKRDFSIAEAAGIRLAAPFLEKKVSDFARALPCSLKTDGHRRKIILRELSCLLGLGKSVSEQRKKAIQYGSGILKVLEKAGL